MTIQADFEQINLAKRMLLQQEKVVFMQAAQEIEKRISALEGPENKTVVRSSKVVSLNPVDHLPKLQMRWVAQWCREGMSDIASAKDCGIVWKQLYELRTTGMFQFNDRQKTNAKVHPEVDKMLKDVFGPVTELEHSQFRRVSVGSDASDFAFHKKSSQKV